ncbi:OmpA family protein [bacterium]|nr:OmpA family protein [bacterium]
MFEEKSKVENKKKAGGLFGSTTKTVSVAHDDGEGNWLVSYADLMTLLFGFFVILSSMSTPDNQKIEKMKKATSEQMGGKYSMPYKEVGEGIKKVLANINLDKEVSFTQSEEGVTINCKGTLFFDSGAAALLPKAQELVDSIADVLVETGGGFKIFVEGHTDDVPIRSGIYPSNWELSAARASTVVRLLETKGFRRENMTPLGLADTKPVLPNRTPVGEPIPANQAENRRIVIRLQGNFTGVEN